MNGPFLRREWGSVSFVVTVLVGIIVVPVALYLGNSNPVRPVSLTTPSPSASATAAPSPRASASPVTSPAPSPSPSP